MAEEKSPEKKPTAAELELEQAKRYGRCPTCGKPNVRPLDHASVPRCADPKHS